jgi:hypothetical protein
LGSVGITIEDGMRAVHSRWSVTGQDEKTCAKEFRFARKLAG